MNEHVFSIKSRKEFLHGPLLNFLYLSEKLRSMMIFRVNSDELKVHKGTGKKYN